MAMDIPPDGLFREAADGRARCWWCAADADYQRYHDEEWGRPAGTDQRLFEKVCLEGFQAGLSWLTILRKREHFRAAFAGFDIDAVARFDDRDVQRLLADPGIVRHRGKITAAIGNARCAQALRAEFGSLASYFWQYEPPATQRPEAMDFEQVRPLAVTEASKALSRDLKARGWRFVGPTTMYALMQAMGLVNDHLQGCSVRDAVEADRSRFERPRAGTR